MKERIVTPKTAALVLGLGIVLVGCATIVSGTRQEVRISSTPSAAQVSVQRVGSEGRETVWQGQAPATVELARKHSYLVTLALDGYRPVEATLESRMNGWVWGNLLFGGLIGIVVDFSNGAAKKLRPNEINVQLVTVTTLSPTGRADVLYAVFRSMGEAGEESISPVPLVRDPSFAAEPAP